MIEIIYSAKNFVILEYQNIYYCYSYKKLIAKSGRNIIAVDKNKIESQKNKCHLKQFKEIIKEIENERI